MKIAGYEIHPLASKWPDMVGDAWHSFTEDVQLRGVVVPVVLAPDGRVVDGRTRLRAWLHISSALDGWGKRHPITTVTKDLKDDEEVFNFIMSMNRERRHISADVVQAVAIESYEWLVTQAAEAKAAGEFKSGEDARPGPGRGNSKTVDPDSGPPFIEPKRDVKKKKEDSTAGKLAKVSGVSHHKGEQMAAIGKAAKDTPEILEAVKAGDVTILEAATLAKDAEALEKVKAGETTPKEAVKEVKAKKAEAKTADRARVIVKDGDLEKVLVWLDAATVADVQKVFDKCNEILN